MRTCSKCGLQASTEEQLSLFCKGVRCKFGYKNICKKCNTMSMLGKTQNTREKNEKLILEYLGGSYKCTDCGVTNSYSAMFDWHHIDASKKEFQITRIKHYPFQRIKKELGKCVLLCANCHRLRHKGDK